MESKSSTRKEAAHVPNAVASVKLLVDCWKNQIVARLNNIASNEVLDFVRNKNRNAIASNAKNITLRFASKMANVTSAIQSIDRYAA